MKTLILILLLLPTPCHSQLFISSEVDPKNAVIGSKVNGPAYDGTFSLGYRVQDFQAQFTYETFREIEFRSYGVRAGKVWNEEGRINYVLLGGLSMIHREAEWLHVVWHSAASISGQIEYHIGPIFFSARSELRYRGDLRKPIYSGYLGIGIKLHSENK